MADDIPVVATPTGQWRNRPNATTPVTAAELNARDDALRDAAVALNTGDVPDGFIEAIGNPETALSSAVSAIAANTPALAAPTAALYRDVAAAIPGTSVPRWDSQELTVMPAATAAPAGEKPVVLAEVRGQSGVLRRVWYAAATVPGADAAYGTEYGGRVRIYTGDDQTPSIDVAMATFFQYGHRGGVYATPVSGRTSRSDTESGGYRHCTIPFDGYLRAELVNTTGTPVKPLYGSAAYTLGDTAHGSYLLVENQFEEAAQFERLVLCDITGAGTLESIFLSGHSPVAFDYAFLESNVEVWVDGHLAITSSGAEDLFQGSWYRVPVGGWPIGRAGESDLPGSQAALWNWFVNFPVRFEQRLRIILPVGQHGQGSMQSPTYDFRTAVGVIADEPPSGEYRTEQAPTINDNLATLPNGALAAPWQQPGDRVPAVQNAGIRFTTDGTDAAMDMRATRTGVTLPEAYAVVGVLAVTGTTGEHELGITAVADGDGYYGGGAHVQLVRLSQWTWKLRVRDGFDTVCEMQVGGGQDLTNTPVWLRLDVDGTRVRASYRLSDTDHWRPIAGFTTTKTGATVGVFSWQGTGVFSRFQVIPLT